MCEFVNFSIAKKLKEKGFDKYCSRAYSEIGCFNDTDTYKSSEEFYCYAPTISQVLKWLREEKKIHLIVEISDSGWYYTYYSNIRWKGDRLKSDKYFTSFKTNSSYELAAIAGVEYVIDNLI